MISVAHAIRVHALQIARYGGAPGLRARGALESALARPFHGFGDEDAYPQSLGKGRGTARSLAINHPLIDGNKRIALVLALYLLHESGFLLTADAEARYQLVIDVATKKRAFTGIVEWLRQHTAPA